MTGCHPTELRCKHGRVTNCLECDPIVKLPSCKHGLVSRCHECDSLEKRLDKLESLLDIKKMEQILLDGANLHLEIMRLTRKLEYSNKECDLDERIKALERRGIHVCVSHYSEILDKVQELEKKLLETRIQFIDQLDNDKRPHKCPVCNGEGRVTLDEPLKKGNTTYFSISCASCNEKGVVWG